MRISDWSSDVCSSDLAFALQAQDDCTFLIRENFGFNHVDTKFTSHGLGCRSIVAGQHDDADAFLSQRRQRFSGCCLDRICNCRSEEHTSELQSLMRISYAVFCLKKKKITINISQYSTEKQKRKTSVQCYKNETKQ